MKTSEHDEQVALFQWIDLNKNKYPELKLCFAIPNGGRRDIITAIKLKAEGVRAGVCDIFLPCARGGYYGLFIELKIGKNKTTEAQNQFIDGVTRQGYKVAVCYGWKWASDVIVEYLEQNNTYLSTKYEVNLTK